MPCFLVIVYSFCIRFRFSGALLHKLNRLDHIKRDLIREHPSHDDFLDQVRDESEPSDPNLDPLAKLAKSFNQSQVSAAKKKSRSKKSPIELELDMFYSTPQPDDSSVHVLDWWKEREDRMPLLATLVRKLLCIPATSASSERMFSTSGQIVSDRRSNLNPENVNKLVYLHTNLRKVDVKELYKVDLETEQEREEREQDGQAKQRQQDADEAGASQPTA